MQAPPPIIISARDAKRLESLLESAGDETAAALGAELERAEIREPAAIPANVVTMHSRVLCVDEDSGEEHVLRLVYPHEADAPAGDVSVLAPVGAALLGLSVGQSIQWPMPGGRISNIRVSDVLFQPEAAGILN